MKTILFLIHTLLWGLLLGANAQAQVGIQVCPIAPPVNMNVTGYVDVGKNVAVGDVIGPWISLTMAQNGMTRYCTLESEPSGGMYHGYPSAMSQFSVQPVNGIITTTGSISHEGQTYTVYRINQGAGKEVGFILSSSIVGYAGFSFGGSAMVGSAENVPYNNAVGSYSNVVLYNPAYQNAGVSAEYRRDIRIRMVKTVNHFPTANSTISFQAAQFALYTGRVAWNGGAPASPLQWQFKSPVQSANVTVNFRTVNAACLTPPVHVPLGEASIWQLPYAGPYDEYLGVPFTFQFNQCPRYTNIVYKFVPEPANASITNGVLPLIAPSTASGVGVQVMNDSVTTIANLEVGPLKFGVEHFSDAFHVSAGHWTYPSHPFGNANYTMNLRARIVRLNPGVQPTAGSVHAAMKVVATYK